MRILQNALRAPFRASQRAFTLIEILVAVAIIAILVVLAVPAYSAYATKSKFSEVITATNPIKTFVSTCAMDGECVSGGVILGQNRVRNLTKRKRVDPRKEIGV